MREELPQSGDGQSIPPLRFLPGDIRKNLSANIESGSRLDALVVRNPTQIQSMAGEFAMHAISDLPSAAESIANEPAENGLMP